MPRIMFQQPDGTTQSFEAPPHWSLMQLAVNHGVAGITGDCGGSMACATCHIHIHPDWSARVTAAGNEQTEEECDILEGARNLKPTSRLSCQIEITDALDGLIVLLPTPRTL